MRYTTVIDIREDPVIYRNHNCRILYLHLCLVAGYHDHNRDKVFVSLRNLAADAGITFSACRHAIRILEKRNIIARKNGVIYVRKWLEENKPTARAKKGESDIYANVIDVASRENGALRIIQMAKAGDPQAIEMCKKHKWI